MIYLFKGEKNYIQIVMVTKTNLINCTENKIYTESNCQAKNLRFITNSIFFTQKIVITIISNDVNVNLKNEKKDPQRVHTSDFRRNGFIESGDACTQNIDGVKHRQTKCDPKKMKGKQKLRICHKQNETSLSRSYSVSHIVVAPYFLDDL